MKVKNYGWTVAGLVVVASVGSVWADSLLSRGDDAVLGAPSADFMNEVKRFQLPPTPFRPAPEVSSSAAELEDLQQALKTMNQSSNDIARIVAHHALDRVRLKNFEDALAQVEGEPPFQVEAGPGDTLESISANNQRSIDSVREANPNLDKLEVGYKVTIPSARPLVPALPPIKCDPGLPEEFAAYFQGALAWRNPALKDKMDARLAWQRVLLLPAEQRQFKSVWAAYMLAKAWEEQDPWKAVGYYQKVRSLAREGFSDRLGLSAASLGWEARLFLQQTNYSRALELYLQQLSSGDPSAAVSLRLTMNALVENGTEQFEVLAKNPYTRQVVTAYLISVQGMQLVSAHGAGEGIAVTNRLAAVVSAWLRANQQAQFRDSLSAESLALAAYQNRQWAEARAWIALAKSSPVTPWLTAKLLFHEGRMEQAGAALSRLLAQFPLRDISDADSPPVDLKENLRCYGKDAARQIRGELGAFHVFRGSYAQALEEFIDGGFWMDAAYVGERIMTVDELKAYVDAHAPAENDEENDDSTAALNGKLRYLLARRLTRTIRGNEARPYYPAEHQADFDRLAEALQAGWDESAEPGVRSAGLFAAARVTRASGMELLGTEVGPDWHICGGNSTENLSATLRRTKAFNLMPATPDEIARASQHNADPEVRFHYRYQAAFLAWEAAKLMNNDSDETATVLCTAGSWLKARDPQTADLFYKALVRRCNATAIGAAADRLRWFPTIEEPEEIVADPAPAPPELLSALPMSDMIVEEYASDFPMPGKSYVIHRGDTLAAISAAASAWGAKVSVQDILEANEGLAPAGLKLGQTIIIPDPR